MPISLQAYPHEIKHKILENTGSPIKKILDIGGNIGQFAITANHFLPEAEIFVFEPNQSAYDLLEKNTKDINGINIFKYGIGKPSKQDLYFLKDCSATGSLIKENSQINKMGNEDQPEKVTIELTNDIKKVTGHNHFDLVKIDVEGYEYEVIKELKNIKSKYLFIEISGNRGKSFFHSDILVAIKENWGDFDINYQGSFTKDSSTFDLLLQLK